MGSKGPKAGTVLTIDRGIEILGLLLGDNTRAWSQEGNSVSLTNPRMCKDVCIRLYETIHIICHRGIKNIE